MKSNNESSEGSKRRRRPYIEAAFTREEVRRLEVVTKEIDGHKWETVMLHPDDILVHEEVQQMAEHLAWPATPIWKFAPQKDSHGLTELRVRAGQVTPENQKAYEEDLVRSYEATMQYQIEQEARTKRKRKKLP